jgi:hypothetical protein
VNHDQDKCWRWHCQSVMHGSRSGSERFQNMENHYVSAMRECVRRCAQLAQARGAVLVSGERPTNWAAAEVQARARMRSWRTGFPARHKPPAERTGPPGRCSGQRGRTNSIKVVQASLASRVASFSSIVVVSIEVFIRRHLFDITHST